jgi:hypothetical protein
MFSVFAVSPEGLQRTMDVPINGKIEFIRPLHFKGRQPDSLLLITVRGHAQLHDQNCFAVVFVR